MQGDSILYWKRFYFKRNPSKRVFQVFSWLGVLIYLLRLCNSDYLKRLFLLPASYVSEGERETLAKQFVREEVVPRFYAEIIEKLRDHLRQGFRVVIISASPIFYLKYLKDHLPESIIIGTDFIFPSKGFFRLPVIDSKWGNMKGATKVRFIKENLPDHNEGKGCHAYSDSHHDIPLLNYAQWPVAVQPNAKLARLAQESGWSILWPLQAKSNWRRNLRKAWLLLSDLGTWPVMPNNLK